MTGLTIEITDRGVLDALAELSRRVQHLRPALDAIGNALESRVQQRFVTKTDPAGHAWAAWAKSTAKQHNGRGSLLEMHGLLLQSLNYQADDSSVVIGFGTPYAVYHEFGANKERQARSATVYFARDEDGEVGNRVSPG